MQHLSLQAVLTISDHRPWDEEYEDEHMFLLQEKINAYLTFIESGEVYQKVNGSIGKYFTISVYFKFELSKKASILMEKIRNVIDGAGYRLLHSTVRAENDFNRYITWSND